MATTVIHSDATRPTEFGKIFPPDPEWLATAPREEILWPDQPIVDPHHHLWDFPGYHYLTPDLAADISGGHNVRSTVFVEAAQMYRTAGPVEMRPVGETEFAAGMAAMSASGGYGPARIAEGIVGHADLRLGAAVRPVLEAHIAAAGGRFRGIRFATAWDPDPAVEGSHTGSVPHLLTDPTVGKGIDVLTEMGLTLDTWVFFPQQEDLITVADRHPEQTIVMNHCGSPLGHGPYATHRDEHFATWERGIRETAKRPNVVCKIGGILARGAAFDFINAPTAPGSEQLAAIWRPWFGTCLEAFGAERCMFESNYPVEKQGVTYDVLWNTFKRTAEHASQDERDALFAGNARRVYSLPTDQDEV